MKKLTAIILTVAIVATQVKTPVLAKTNSVKSGDGIYTITNEKKKEVRFDKVSKKSVKSLTIPATVEIGGVKYNVVAVKENALKNNKKIKSLVLGENIQAIKKKAFYNCKYLKSITFRTQKLKSVGSYAFGKINSKAVATMSKMTEEKERDYVNILARGGFLEKKQVLKVKNFAGIPDPEIRFAIGELKSGDEERRWRQTTTDATYTAGDNVKFTMWVKPKLEMYGSWNVKRRKVMKQRERCICKKYFDACTNGLAVHIGQTGHGAIAYTRNWMKGKETMPMWYWIQDYAPCKVVYHATLPEGLTVNSDSVEVWIQSIEPINQTDGKYIVQISGRDVAVTINNIKPVPYRMYNDGPIAGIVVKFSAHLEDSAADVNQINADISYSYGKINKTMNMDPVIVRKE